MLRHVAQGSSRNQESFVKGAPPTFPAVLARIGELMTNDATSIHSTSNSNFRIKGVVHVWLVNEGGRAYRSVCVLASVLGAAARSLLRDGPTFCRRRNSLFRRLETTRRSRRVAFVTPMFARSVRDIHYWPFRSTRSIVETETSAKFATVLCFQFLRRRVQRVKSPINSGSGTTSSSISGRSICANFSESCLALMGDLL